MTWATAPFSCQTHPKTKFGESLACSKEFYSISETIRVKASFLGKDASSHGPSVNLNHPFGSIWFQRRIFLEFADVIGLHVICNQDEVGMD